MFQLDELAVEAIRLLWYNSYQLAQFEVFLAVSKNPGCEKSQICYHRIHALDMEAEFVLILREAKNNIA